MPSHKTRNRAFHYIESIWLGVDGRVSLRAVGAIALLIDFIRNTSHAIWKWDAGRSLEGLSLVLGIEAGLIVSLLGLTAWNNIANKKIESGDYGNTTNTNTNIPPIKVENVESILVQPKEEKIKEE